MAGFDLMYVAHVPETLSSAGFTGVGSNFTPYEEDRLAEYLWNKIIGNPCPVTEATSEISLGGVVQVWSYEEYGYFYILLEAGIEEASLRPCYFGLWKLAGERTVQQQSITVGHAKEWDYHMFGVPPGLKPAFRMTEYRLNPAIVPLEASGIRSFEMRVPDLELPELIIARPYGLLLQSQPREGYRNTNILQNSKLEQL
ncbi:hypothetical protein ACFX13_011626 [Malus domestica]